MTGNEALLTFALIAGGFLLGGVMFSRALPKLLTGKDVCALRADKNQVASPLDVGPDDDGLSEQVSDSV